MASLRFLLILVLVSAVGSAFASDERGPDAPRARVADDGARLVVRDATGAVRFDWTVEAWQAWATPRFDDRLDARPTLGGNRLGPADFTYFGPAAVSPDGTRVAFTVTSYAMLVTVTLTGVVDLPSGAVALMRTPMDGSVDAFAWSPEGRYLATVLGTARSAGERLVIDEVASGERQADLGARALLEASGLPPRGAGEGPYLPHLREPTWTDAGHLRFTADAVDAVGNPDRPSEPGVRWRIRPDGAGLERLP